MSPSKLARAERALSEGDVEGAMEALIAYAEERGRGDCGETEDERFDSLAKLTVEMAEL